MRRLLITGLYVPGSGLTNVMTALVSQLRHRFEIRCLGFHPAARKEVEEARLLDCPLFLQGMRSQLFHANQAWLASIFESWAPQHVLVISPGFLAEKLLTQFQSWRSGTKLHLYLPIEGGLAGDVLAPILDLIDSCILYTDCARRDVEALSARMEASGKPFRSPKLAAIPHGVDRSLFFPFEGNPDDRHRAARNKMGRPDLADAFLVLNVNRPYHRKRLDLTIAGFGRFAADEPRARLILHTGHRTAEQERQIGMALAASGVAERIELSPSDRQAPPLELDSLNLLYNACEVGLTTAMGEGWGLGVFEHAATRAAQIVPDHTSFRENWTGAAALVPTTGREFIFYEAADMFTVSPEGVAHALSNLHAAPSLRRSLADAAFARAAEKRFSWESVSARFAAHLEASAATSKTGSLLSC